MIWKNRNCVKYQNNDSADLYRNVLDTMRTHLNNLISTRIDNLDLRIKELLMDLKIHCDDLYYKK